VPAIFEAALLYGGVLIRADVLERVPSAVGEPCDWRLIEVKSSTRVKDIHLEDLAVQSEVVAGAGLRLVSVGLMAPVLANLLYLSGRRPLDLDPTPYGFTLTAALLAWGFSRQGILEAMPVSRSTVVRELRDALLVVDPRGRLVDVNLAARGILGLLDSFVQDLQVHEVLAGCPQLLALLERPDGEMSSTVEIQTKAGARMFDVRISELRERSDVVAGRLVVLRDVTDYLKANEAARAAAVAKSQFLANMSHEIRTPLNGVLGQAQHLAQLQLDTEQRTAVDDLLRSGEALLPVIGDILDLSKLEAGRMTFSFASVSLPDVVDLAVDEFRSLYHEREIELRSLTDPRARAALDLRSSAFGSRPSVLGLVRSLLWPHPAAWGALVPLVMVQARTSLTPAVK
jgi:signal transduction histidine kinase